MPSAMSRPKDPVEVVSMSWTGLSAPSFIIEPLPNCRSIWVSALSSAFLRSAFAFAFLDVSIVKISAPAIFSLLVVSAFADRRQTGVRS